MSGGPITFYPDFPKEFLHKGKKVKISHYRSGQALRVPEV
jgi:hypothetical protein